MSPISVKFVSKKISKLRWIPRNPNFVTGSYDDQENVLCVWKCPTPSSPVNDNMDNGDDATDPKELCVQHFPGSVTDLNAHSEEVLFASSSLGSILMYKYSDARLDRVHKWEHSSQMKPRASAVSGISVKGHNIVSVGEDSRLCIFNYSTTQKIKEIESSDLCSFTAVSYLRHQEIVTGNALGYLRIWDVRLPSDAPSSLLLVSREQSGVTCLCIHPTQSHVLATGRDDGSLSIWDLRQSQQPMTVLEGHTAAITELLFHPINPDHLFTCSMDCCVFHWDATKLKSVPSFVPTPDHNPRGTTWLNCDTNKHKVETTSLFCSRQALCVNTLDLRGTTLIWGTDNEALYTCNDVFV